MRTAFFGILVVPLFFLLSLILLPKNTFALGATGLGITNETCDASGQVNVTFNWTPQPDGAFHRTDAQWLDLSTNAADPYGPGKFINHDVIGASSYSTSTLPNNIGPLIPGTPHYWRINTLNGYTGIWSADTAGYSGSTNFTTRSCPAPGASTCDTTPAIVAPGGTITVNGRNFGGLSLPIGMVNGFGTGDTPLPNPTGGADPFSVAEVIPTGTLSGTYRAYVNAGGFGKVACTNLFDVSTTGAGTTAECQPGSAKTDAEAVDQENKCRISLQIYDDKATTFNIVAGLGDGLYKMLSGKSRLYPQTNGVTAGTGALASSGTMIAALYSHPPVSGMQYMASQFNKFNPVTPVYAQETGIGFNTLAPVQGIWESFRNIAYIGFVLVFVIIGFMIMFRAHISPQAVATVQDSLPRIVIALFLVTFSYAIAGFMIDIMFLLLNVIITALPGDLTAKQYIFHKSVFGVFFGSWKETFGVVSDALTTVIDNVSDMGVLDKLLKYFGGVIGALIVGIALLFVMFKVFLMLLTSYAYIVILTITAPFFFLAQALPGNNGGQSWFKQMAANIAVFPVVAIMFIFAGIMGGIQNLGGSAGGAIQSGNVGSFPLLSGDIDPNAVGKLIAIGILLMTPSAAELIKNAIGAKGMQGGGGAGAALAAGAAVIGAGPGALGRATGRQAADKAGSAVYGYGRDKVSKVRSMFSGGPAKESG